MAKIGRNEICPCGSGKKFKKCHGDLSAPIAPPGQIDAQLRRLAPKVECLSPKSFHANCKGKVISSHTVSRSGSLGEIMENGHVYSYRVSVRSFDALQGLMKPVLTGWREASTFPGFCVFHDKNIFSPLEDESFTGSEEQCYLLAYRALAWEYYAKLRATKSNGFRQAVAGGIRSLAMQRAIDEFNKSGDLGLSDLTSRKSGMDAALEKSDWKSLRGLLIEFNQIFPIQCAAAWSPTEDLHGEYLQSLGNDNNLVPEGATISSFAAGGKSYFLLSWLSDSDNIGLKLANSIERVPDSEKAGALAAWFLQTSDNCHFSPKWFDNLSEDIKDNINTLMHPIGQSGSAVSNAARVGIGSIGIASCRRIGAI